MSRVWVVGVVLFLNIVCGVRPATAQLLPPILGNIFGPDQRVEAPLDKDPYRQVVRIQRRNHGEWGRCTGAIIGPKLVLTALHCFDDIVDWETDELRDIVVAEAQARGHQVARMSRVAQVVARGNWTADAPRARSEDWAILRLEADLSEQFGALGIGVEITGTEDLNTGDLLVPGYGNSSFQRGRIMTVGEPCSAKNFFPSGLFYHDCATTRGSSGGPVLKCVPQAQGGQACTIIGVNVAEFRNGGEQSLVLDEYSDRSANVAVNAWKFIGAVHRALAGQL